MSATPVGSEPATFQLVARCVNRQRQRVRKLYIGQQKTADTRHAERSNLREIRRYGEFMHRSGAQHAVGTVPYVVPHSAVYSLLYSRNMWLLILHNVRCFYLQKRQGGWPGITISRKEPLVLMRCKTEAV